MRVEVALSGTVKGWVLGVFATVVILDVLETLSEIFVVVRLGSVCLENNMGEESSKLTFAHFSRSKTQAGVIFTTEFGEETSGNNKCLIGVKFVMKREKMLKILFTKDLHNASNILLVLVLDSRAALKRGRLDLPLSLRVLTVGYAIFDTNALIIVKPVVTGPYAIIIGLCESDY